MLRIGWFSTGRDEAACQLLEAAWQAIQRSGLKAQIAFVFSNRERGESPASDRFFDLVEGYSLPLVCLSSKRFRQERGEPPARAGEPLPPWRAEYDQAVMRLLEPYPFDLGVLAGYMLIIGEEMCRKYNMINLHPAAPGGPAGTWQEVIWQLIEHGAGETGVMMHLVTPELDKGPPVTYCTFPIRDEPFDRYWAEIKQPPAGDTKRSQDENNPLFRLIRRHGLAREFPLIISTLRAFGRGEVRISPDKQVVNAEGKPIKGYNMTDEINRLVKGMISQ